jgi:hypothetical protein
MFAAPRSAPDASKTRAGVLIVSRCPGCGDVRVKAVTVKRTHMGLTALLGAP